MLDKAVELERISCDEYFLRHVLQCAPTRGLPRTVAEFNSKIHPADQMMQHSLAHHGDAGAAFSQYYNVALQQYAAFSQVAALFLPGEGRDGCILDFACGYGRLLRFLPHDFDVSNIWCADIQPDAVSFARDSFGVNGLVSTEDPADFDAAESFDLIWVASLFSHLPETLFVRWLQKLVSLLTPQGVLCFSVRDISLLPGGECGKDGFVYSRVSENPNLPDSIYGTAYARESFVVRALETALGSCGPYRRISRGLAQEQDLYVVSRDRERDLSALKRFRFGTWGWVDELHMSLDSLELRGWAASLDRQRVTVEIVLGDSQFRLEPCEERHDVASHFSRAELFRSGWTFRCSIRPGSALPLVVTAYDGQGARALLYAGTIAARSS